MFLFGKKIPIIHVANALLVYGSNKIKLNNVLLVPNLQMNMLSVRPFTSTHPITCGFNSVGLTIMDRTTRQVLMLGRKKGNLFLLPIMLGEHFFFCEVSYSSI